MVSSFTLILASGTTPFFVFVSIISVKHCGLDTRELYLNKVILLDNSFSNLNVTASKVVSQAYRVLSSAKLQSLVYESNISVISLITTLKVENFAGTKFHGFHGFRGQPQNLIPAKHLTLPIRKI